MDRSFASCFAQVQFDQMRQRYQQCNVSIPKITLRKLLPFVAEFFQVQCSVVLSKLIRVVHMTV